MIFQNTISRRFVLAALIFCSTHEVFADSAGSDIYNFLKVNPSPISAALGESNTFITSQSFYVNPAVLPWIGARELSVEQLSYLLGSNFSLINYACPLDDSGAIGFSLGYLGVGGFTRTVADASASGYFEGGDFEYDDILASAGYGKKISRTFSYGVSFKAVRESIDGNTSSGIMLSAGGLYNPQGQGCSWGFGVFNLGPQVKGFNLPSGAYLGFSDPIIKCLKWTGEGVAFNDGVIDIFSGLEYNIKELFFLRGGYRYPLADNQLGNQTTINFSGGIGFNIKSFEFDYAWVPYGDLGATNRVSVTVKFDS